MPTIPLRAREPTDKERRDWVNGLLDRANVVHTSADEMEPGDVFFDLDRGEWRDAS